MWLRGMGRSWVYEDVVGGDGRISRGNGSGS